LQYTSYFDIFGLKKTLTLLKKNTSASLEAYSNELHLRKMQSDISGAFGMQ